jgi:hypothetical protein
MSAGKTVTLSAAANGAAQIGTEAAIPQVQFLDIPLWIFEVNGILTKVTPQTVIVLATFALSVVAVSFSIYAQLKKRTAGN